jgi:hypothetical protein
MQSVSVQNSNPWINTRNSKVENLDEVGLNKEEAKENIFFSFREEEAKVVIVRLLNVKRRRR